MIKNYCSYENYNTNPGSRKYRNSNAEAQQRPYPRQLAICSSKPFALHGRQFDIIAKSGPDELSV
jgi:hypothetical protein